MDFTNRSITWRSIAAIFLFFLLFCSIVSAQDNFIAIPDNMTDRYRIDFARHFFATPEAEKTARAELDGALKDLESLKGKITSSAGNLLRALQLNDKIQILFIRRYNYFYLRYAVNTADAASNDEASALDAEINRRTAFFNRELIEISDRNLAAFVRQKPKLKTYLFAIENVRRYRPFTLSLKEEELLSLTAPLTGGWQYDLYEKLIPHNQAALPANADTRGGSDAERAKREIQFKNHYAGFASQRDLYAFTLLRLVAAQTQIAKLHHFEDAAGYYYFPRYWTKAEVSQLLEQLTQNAGLYKRYEQLQVDYIKRITGYQEVNRWDLPLTSKNVRIPRFTIREATQIIEKALAPLGIEYEQELAKLLDPANRRMDIVPGKNRRGGGFSRGFIGSDSVFFSGGFRGFYNDVRVLTHESTHAVHRQLMNKNRILPAYAQGPNYLFEAFAIFNEFLLPDYLYEHESDPALKRYYLQQFLDGKGLQMFVVAPEAMLEEAIYKSAAAGRLKTADELDALTKQIFSRFSIFPEKHDELKNQWMNIRLMFQDPFYDVNYVYGALLALKFYEMYRRDPQDFVPRYTALLRNGFNAPPEVLLKRFLKIDLRDSRLLPDVLKIIEEKINLLEKSYQESDAGQK